MATSINRMPLQVLLPHTRPREGCHGLQSPGSCIKCKAKMHAYMLAIMRTLTTGSPHV